MVHGLSRRSFLAALAAPYFVNAKPLFEEVSAESSGILWKHDNAMSPARHLPETLGPGCAFLDYDNDGWMDIYLVNSGPCDFYKPGRPLCNALYRNNRDGTFTDVTERAGVPGGTFGMGVAVADYDNDGFPDIFVTGYGRCILYRNNHNGTFTDVTERAGLAISRRYSDWTTSAVWFDYDNDGRLDLFVCSFVRYDPAGTACSDDPHGRKYYCIPRVFQPTASLLFHNNGDGTFSETGGGTAIGKALGKALGVVATDIDNDGRMDLFVANDTEPNFLFLNAGGNAWTDIGLDAGVALDFHGNPRSGMGVDAADYDGDGREDLFVANVDQEAFSLYRNRNGLAFEDTAYIHGIAQTTYYLSGWGLRFFDIDNDGELDLLLANGHPDDMVHFRSPKVRYREPLLLFRGRGGNFRNISSAGGPVFSKDFAARSLATGDYNNDGRLDVLVGVNGERPVLLKNNAGAGNHWFGLKLQGKSCNRDAIGARITWSVRGIRRSRLRRAGGSYLSSHDPREILGLGPNATLDWVEIQWPWPSTRLERFHALPLDRYTTVIEGSGTS